MQNNNYERWKNIIEKIIMIELRKKKTNYLQLISYHPYLPLRIVEAHIHQNWNIKGLSRHPDMNRDIFRKLFPGKKVQIHTHSYIRFYGNPKFDFHKWEKKRYKKMDRELSYHGKLPVAFILKYPNIVWDYSFLLMNKKWTIRDIYVLIKQKKMNWHLFSRNPFINIEIILEFLRYPWDWRTLAIHPSFPPHKIYIHPILFCKWKWKWVYMNPRLTSDFWYFLIQKYPKVFKELQIILQNRFQYDMYIRMWSSYHIQHFLIHHYHFRLKIIDKLYLHKYLRTSLCPDIYKYILTFI